MSVALKCLERIDKEYGTIECEDFDNCFNIIKQALQRLEAIDNIFEDCAICEIQKKFAKYDKLCEETKCEKCALCVGNDICLRRTFERKWELQKEHKTLEKQLSLLKKVLNEGILVKCGKREYELSPEEFNVKIKENGFIIEELYFDDLDCVMDTTGFEVYSQDYKKTWWLKKDKSE